MLFYLTLKLSMGTDCLSHQRRCPPVTGTISSPSVIHWAKIRSHVSPASHLEFYSPGVNMSLPSRKMRVCSQLSD